MSTIFSRPQCVKAHCNVQATACAARCSCNCYITYTAVSIITSHKPWLAVNSGLPPVSREYNPPILHVSSLVQVTELRLFPTLRKFNEISTEIKIFQFKEISQVKHRSVSPWTKGPVTLKTRNPIQMNFLLWKHFSSEINYIQFDTG